MNLAPNSINFMEFLKGYSANTFFITTREVGGNYPPLPPVTLKVDFVFVAALSSDITFRQNILHKRLNIINFGIRVNLFLTVVWWNKYRGIRVFLLNAFAC
jgi:hypothetical protein